MKTIRPLFLIACVFSLLSSNTLHAQPTHIIVSTTKETSFVDEVEALGTLRGNENVALTASVTELVTAINFEDGQRVKKGDVLVEMDIAEERALLKEEKSVLEEAKTQYDRAKALAQRAVSTESVLDERNRLVNTSEARIEAIKSRIEQRKIRAPFDGKVGLRNISVGSLIQPGTLITTIDDDSVMKLDFSVPEVFLSTLNPSLKISATTRAYPEESFTGTISSVDSRVDPVTRAIVARALIDNESRKLKPGMLMRVTLQKNPRKTLVVPEEAVILNGEQHFVLVVIEQNGETTVERRNVKLGVRRKGEVEVVEGLKKSERVVTHGTLTAKPGKPVKIQERIDS